MIDILYQLLNSLGYTHPLHPPLTHLPLGLIMGAFFFGAVAVLRKHSDLAVTAHYCTFLALLGFFATVLFGYSDWQHYYQGAMLYEIKAKIILAVALFLALVLAFFLGRKEGDPSRLTFAAYALCFILASSLGYLGGEIVFKGRVSPVGSVSSLVGEGEKLFVQNCSACHRTDSTEAKLGPGLKGLFKRDTMASTGQPVNDETVRRQIQSPAKLMPPFPSLIPQQMDALIAYLKTL